MDPINRLAREKFAVSYLYPIQRFVISNILEGISQIVVLPTGSGKSLCFLLPSLVLKGVTLVVVPLLSLLQDQIKRLEKVNIRAGVIRGGQSSGEREQIFAHLRKGDMVLLYATPEALLSSSIKKSLKDLRIAHLVVDEAHCISEWGPGFRPDYLKIGQVAEELKIPLLSAFTATASERVLADIRKAFFGGRMVSRVIDTPDRPNISYSVLPVISTAGALSRLVKEEKKPILIFSRTRKGAEACARYLIERILEEKVLFYHAGLDLNERNNVEAWFMGSDSAILTATSAYGMGIDKADIRTIIHVDLPRSIESYLQQSGRGGRDGKPARSILFYSIPDARDLLAGIERNKGNSILERERCRQIVEYAGGFTLGEWEWPRAEQCRRTKLLSILSKEEVACSGCDVCSGEAVTLPEGFTEILSLVKRYKRLFTVRELYMILAGRRNSDSLSRGFDRLDGFGILKKWDDIAIEMAVSAMVRAGRLTVVERGFRRYRVTLGKGFVSLSGNKARSTF